MKQEVMFAEVEVQEKHHREHQKPAVRDETPRRELVRVDEKYAQEMIQLYYR